MKMRLIALDPDSIELMKLSKKFRKAKTPADRKLALEQIAFYQDRVMQKVKGQ